jgi:hypothetical protein
MSQHKHLANYADVDVALEDIRQEVSSAEAKFPLWPDDVIHGAAVMAEEAGEAVKAALECVYGGADPANLPARQAAYRKELLHTAAMCVRAILDIDREARRV